MSEYYPGPNPEFGQNSSEKNSKDTKKGGSRFEVPERIIDKPKVEKSAAYNELTAGEKFKPLGDIFKTQTEQKPATPELAQEPLPEKKASEIPEHGERLSAEEMRAQAARDAAEQLAHHEREMLGEAEKEKSDKEEDDKKKDEKSPKIVKQEAKPAREAEESSEDTRPVLEREPQSHEATELSDDESQKFAEIIQNNAPEMAAAASGETLTEPAEARPAIGPKEEQSPQQPTETDAAFATIAASPELADLAAKKVPEAPGIPLEDKVKPEGFSDWVTNDQPELITPEMAAASNPDDGFDAIVRNSLGGNPPGETRYFEQTPGEPPIDAGAGHNQPPNFPSTAEGGTWDNGDDGPESGYGADNAANPNVFNNPWTPAGGLTEPGVWAAMGALEAQQQFNSLRHTAAEVGLTGAVVILGLGHIRNRHKINQQNRRLNRQEKQINALGTQLQRERLDHTATKTKLEQVGAAERTSQASREGLKISRPETAIVGAPVPAVAKTEGGPVQTAQKSEQNPDLNKQELNWYLENNREAGRAIERNPELRDVFEAAAAAPLAEQLEANKANERPVFNQEGTHEQLQNQYLDAAGVKRSANGTDSQTVPLPTTQPDYATATFQQPPPNATFENQFEAKSGAAKPVAAGAALFVVLIILFFVFVR